MSKKKDDSFIPYKFKELLVYGSPEWLADGKKKYQRVFEASETSYLYAEFSFYNKLFDEYDWDVKVNLKSFEVDQNFKKVKEICSIDVDRKVKIDENVVFIREGWGNARKGGFWKKGKYLWEASLNGKVVGTQYFYIETGGMVTEDDNPYFSIASLKLFEGGNSLPAKETRTYYTSFAAKDTRYVWGELGIVNLREEDWYGEFVFNFYNDARQLKGRTEELKLIKKDQKTFELCSGWGSDHKGTWYEDNYTLEIVFMEHLLAVVPFKVGNEFEEGETTPLKQHLSGAAIMADPVPEKTLDEVLEEFNELVGLVEIKGRIREYTQYLNFLKLRKEKGFEESDNINLHSVFTGNPGTGKTTVAKMLGRIYQKMGLLTKGHVHEVDRADLVGEYIGQTAPKVKEAIKKARGGILFIDEAYALARGNDDSKDYGREVLEILIKEMSDGKGDLAVIVAGYPKEMATFLDSNPGIKSRFNQYFDFSDYLPQELMLIAEFSAKHRDVSLTTEAKEFMYEKLIEAYRNRDRTFGNARYVNSLIDEAKMNLGLRIMQSESPDELTESQLSTIQVEDMKKIFMKGQREAADIPIDEPLLQASLAELKSLIGLSSVKTEIQELVKLVKFYREVGKDVMHTFSLHTVFTGNPGTGKTTVARILAKIFKALGILEKGHIVEVDRQGLVAGYVGQTAARASARIDEAIGGVLFIDEAYALTQGGMNDYGKEAVETLLKRMEDQRGQFVVIAAGYPDNMKRFLESNPGLKSRFDKHLDFEDYTSEELYQIALMMLDKEGLNPDDSASRHLMRYFNFLFEHKDKFFGNARSVRKVIEEAVKNQHLRLAGLPKEMRTDEMLHTLMFPDVEEFKCDKDALINQGQRIGFGLPPKGMEQKASGGKRKSSLAYSPRIKQLNKKLFLVDIRGPIDRSGIEVRIEVQGLQAIQVLSFFRIHPHQPNIFLSFDQFPDHDLLGLGFVKFVDLDMAFLILIIRPALIHRYIQLDRIIDVFLYHIVCHNGRSIFGFHHASDRNT